VLPVPFFDSLPRAFQDLREGSAVALADKMDELLLEWKRDAVEVGNLYDPERCPAKLLDSLGLFLQAGIAEGDVELTKRKKIRSAIESHKKRSVWEGSAKPLVDAVTGGDAVLLGGLGSGEWIITGDGTFPASSDTGVLSGDGELEAGLIILGTGDEPEVKGNVYIDTRVSGLTSEQVQQVVLSLSDVAPAYFRIHIGYTDGSGQFVEYTVMG
jgi:hypothetical protein